MNTEQALAWWQARPTREKVLLGFVSLAVFAALGDSLFTAPLEKRLKRERGQSAAIAQKLDNLRPAGGSAEEALQLVASLRERLTQAQARNDQLRRQLADSAKLPETLRAITTTVGSARLLALELSAATDGSAPGVPAAAITLANALSPAPNSPAPNSPATTADGSAMASAAPRRLYRLPITLKVSGSYGELQLLMAQIERHAQALQWASLTLDSGDWPAIQLTLKAHVLSTEARWGAPS